MRRIVAVFLVLAIAICLLPAAAFADNAETSAEPSTHSIWYAFKAYDGRYVTVNGDVIMMKGTSYKNYVNIIQSVLTELYKYTDKSKFNPKGVDGKFGDDTHLAVVCFQVAYMGADEGDGAVGQRTWAKLQDVWTNLLGSPALPGVYVVE